MIEQIDYLKNYHKGTKMTTYGEGELNMHDHHRNEVIDATNHYLTVLQKIADGEDWFEIDGECAEGWDYYSNN